MTQMKKTKEQTGLWIEIIGLCLILSAAIWQVFVTDWFDNFSTKSRSYIQETANIAILGSIHDMSLAQLMEDPVKRKELMERVSDNSNNAIFDLVRIRDQQNFVVLNQAKYLKMFRVFIFLLGAALIALGKYFVLQHKLQQSNNAI